ncbi:MAG: CDP-alcohol phosphatidyltransferase family protein [Rhodospirillaceae bacterium]|mgnify:FL=1|nr:CDP-alcohol phosphatidyltransferase family protein [Rhodospirillaceae bacterium]MBT4463638.1 CDP-alcohol phosphatidyltransferase family protein [Rhodospirillaceae bacterium]MBT5013611.1 CDP-alcohol phosphatidyltransferase family protein [Rhodospirillaceae bacterium]MBT5309590.1 CDP-alcohol phosphatidyltransferase family protein [Rhodospirillaceae bacterium]MBT7354924.1 CDP-alcohol phosphatidyltransferase family protein [Rhodospirillaceae bacterium]
MKTPVTPNQLTVLRLLAGLSAAGLLALGTQPHIHWAAGLFVASMLLDRADGDLARMTGRTSPMGHTYDLIADALCNTLIFVGLGIGLRASEYGLGAIAMGVLAGGSVAAILWLVLKIEKAEGARAAEIKGAAGFDPDDTMVLIPISIWLGWSEGLLLAAAIGAPMFAIFFYWLFLRKRKSVASDHNV